MGKLLKLSDRLHDHKCRRCQMVWRCDFGRWCLGEVDEVCAACALKEMREEEDASISKS